MWFAVIELTGDVMSRMEGKTVCFFLPEKEASSSENQTESAMDKV